MSLNSYKYPMIPSVTNENMERHWGPEFFNISYKDKVVLDLGASIGDAAEYFLHEGANRVISVEGNLLYFTQLMENSKLFEEKLIPIHIYIENTEQIEQLIIDYLPDVVKCDIEGAELHLVHMKDEVWKLVPEYIVEMHEGYAGIICKIEDMRIKCRQTNYKILTDISNKIFNHMIYAVRR